MMNTETSFNHKRLWFVPDTAPYTQPVRYTKDDIVVVKSERIGAPAEPYSVEFLLHIKGTEHYVALSYENGGGRRSFYDLKHAKLVTPEGKPLRGKQSEASLPRSAIFLNACGGVSLWGGTPPNGHTANGYPFLLNGDDRYADTANRA